MNYSLLLLCMCVLASTALATNYTGYDDSEAVGDDSGADSVKEEPMDLALVPLYKMTNNFIKVVFPKGVDTETISKFFLRLRHNQHK